MATINGTSYNDNGTFQGTYPYLIFYPILRGTSVADTIYGYGGHDILDGGAGADTMYGGTGNDSYYVDNTGDLVVENLNEGTDIVYASITYTLRNNVENLTLTGTGVINGYGNSLNNVMNGNSANNIIYGYGGNDTINGGAGADTMYGGTGNDSYYVDNTGDLVVENLNEGTDIVYASITYTLRNNVENLTLTATGVINGYGNSLNNVINGNSANNIIYGYGGNDTINGGAGADIMYGGTGNDSYYVDNTGDLVVENLNEGTDIVYASITYTLRNNVENLSLTGTGVINGYGNSLNNGINGNGANNIIYGYGGNDTINGGAGADTMYGGTGNDSYYVDNTGDLVVENLNEGTDTVYASITYTLRNNVENLTLTGTGVINGYGNSLNNVINGNSANNIIYGYGGNDTINGGAGADIMYGGAGNDSYYVDNTGDLVVENLNEGTDIVYASITYTLRNNVENLTLTGTGVINGYGNSLNNVINGNSANNIIYGYGGNDTINGGAGADIMYGGAGNDIYYVDNINDIVAENFNEGIDTVYASVDYLLRSYSSSLDLIMRSDPENIILTGTSNLIAEGSSVDNTIIGNSGNNLLYGYGGNDTIYGRDGDDSIYAGSGGGYIYGENGNDQLLGGDDIDTLFGGAGDDLLLGNGGNDVLYGGAGADYFYFIYLSEGIDMIMDFESSEKDKILIDQVGFGASSLSQFTYDSSTGNLFFQSTQFATIVNNPLGFNILSDLVLL